MDVVHAAAIKDRFDQPSYKTFAALDALERAASRTIYGDDVFIDSLQVEFGIFKHLFTKIPACCFDHILDTLKKTNEVKYLI